MASEIMEYNRVSHSLFQRMFRRPPQITIHEAIKLPDDFCDKNRLVVIGNVIISYSKYTTNNLTGMYISHAGSVKYETIVLLFKSDSVITTDSGLFLKLDHIKRISSIYDFLDGRREQVATDDMEISGRKYRFTKNVNVREKVIYAIDKLHKRQKFSQSNNLKIMNRQLIYQCQGDLHDLINNQIKAKKAFYNNKKLAIEMYSDSEFIKSIQFKTPAVLQVCDKMVKIYSIEFDENLWETMRDTIFRFTYTTHDGAKLQLSDTSNEIDDLIDGIFLLMNKTFTWSSNMFITGFYQSECDNDEGYDFSTPNNDGSFTGTIMAAIM